MMTIFYYKRTFTTIDGNNNSTLRQFITDRGEDYFLKRLVHWQSLNTSKYEHVPESCVNNMFDNQKLKSLNCEDIVSIPWPDNRK